MAANEHLLCLSLTLCPPISYRAANKTIVQQPARMLDLSRNLLEHARSFIRRAEGGGHKWFYYYSDLLPHTPLFNDPRFGPGPPGPFVSANGQYGQVVSAIDANVGELLALLDDLGAAKRTLVLFTSDNGPYREEGYAASGRTCGLKGGKGQVWEGGIRVPAIVRWPGTIPPGSISDAPMSILDLVPTVAALAGVRLPSGLTIDGVSQAEFLRSGGLAEANPWARGEKTQLHHCGTQLIAARYKNFKLFWATQRWADAANASASIGTYDASVCTQCCPQAGWTSGLFGSATVCQCSPEALQYHDHPLVFDMSKDPNETIPIPSTGEFYAQVSRAAEEARRDFAESRVAERGDREDWCANCMLPLPLNIWPCCGGDGKTAAAVARRKPECSGAADAARAASVAAWATQSPAASAELMNCLPHGAAANLTALAASGVAARALAGTLCTCNYCTGAAGACPVGFV
jgi:hypothetical protein